jgi:hypothetical protein
MATSSEQQRVFFLYLRFSFSPHIHIPFIPHSFMARLSFFVFIAFLLSVVPTSLAGPACAKKHYKAVDCIQKCKSRWGWTGSMMGNDPWGSVVKKTDATINWDSVISQACGSDVYVMF